MIASIGILLRPRSTLAALAERPRLIRGAAAVIGTGIVSSLLNVLATALEPHQSRREGFAVSVALPFLFVLFWAVSAWMIGAGARPMGAGSRRRDYLAVSGHIFPILIAYTAIPLAQAASLRWGGSAGAGIGDAIGLLALPILLWFVVVSTLAARAIYEVSTLPALSLALLPYAALSAAILVLILGVSVLRWL